MDHSWWVTKTVSGSQRVKTVSGSQSAKTVSGSQSAKTVSGSQSAKTVSGSQSAKTVMRKLAPNISMYLIPVLLGTRHAPGSISTYLDESVEGVSGEVVHPAGDVSPGLLYRLQHAKRLVLRLIFIIKLSYLVHT